MNPGDEAQAPIGSIQADDPGANVVEPLCPSQEGLCKRGIMSMSRRKQKEERQARTATDEGMHPIAQQQGTRMMSGSVPKGRIGITASPSQDGSAVNDEITSSDESSSHGLPNRQHKK